MKILHLILIFLLALSQINCHKGEIKGKAYLFDLGPSESDLSPKYTQLSHQASYNPARGYGWLNSPDTAIVIPVYLPNHPLLKDGLVFNKKISFRMDIPAGDYFLNVVIGQYSDTAAVSLAVGDQSVEFTFPFRRLDYQSQRIRISVPSDSLILRITPTLGAAVIKGIELQPVVPMKSISFKTELEFDSLEVRRFSDQLEKRLQNHPDDVQASAQWLSCQKYLLAAHYYDIGWWSWAVEETGMSIFPRYDIVSDLLRQIIANPEDPLHDRAVYLLGRTHYWLYLEQKFEPDKVEYERFFSMLKDKYPDHDRLQMYAGEMIPHASPCQSPDTDAPKWAQLQHELMCRMLEVIHWWVEEKQAENGELGGKFGDDVEILRTWLPAILGADDSLARVGYTRLAEGVWESGKLKNAYSKKLEDVEHAAELFRDTHAAMQMIQYGDPRYVERGMICMQNFRDVWSGTTSSGHLHLKSNSFSATELLEEPPFGVDIPMNARATLPSLWTGWYNRNPEIIRLFSQWGKAWVAAANRTDRGKPKGLLPAAVSFADEKIGGYGPTWYHPRLGWPYYKWERLGGISEMYNQLLGMYLITNDAVFLDPVRQTFELALSTETSSAEAKRKEGSAAWAGAYLRGEHGSPINMFNQARVITSRKDFDPFLTKYGSNYTKYLITQDLDYIEEELAEALEGLRHNFPLYTDEVKFTDRVYIDGEKLLFGMYTGFSGRGMESPGLSVSWENTGRDISVLVHHAETDSLVISLYNFGAEKEIKMNVWRLPPGEYTLRLTDESGQDQINRNISISERGQSIPLNIPSKQISTLQVSQISITETNLFPAADIAIGPTDVYWESDPSEVALMVRVHNIGSADAKDIELKVSADKKTVYATQIDLIEAPNDLDPRFMEIRIPLSQAIKSASLNIEISCAQKEITLRNNLWMGKIN